MRTIIFQLAFLLLALNVQAQKFIQPLPCGTWGEQNWTIYTAKDLERKTYPGAVDLDSYYNFQPSNEVSFLTRDQDYINNVQCIRWTLDETEEPFKITVSENGKRVILYEAETKGCGLIFFPDSLMKSPYSELQVIVEGGGLPTKYFYFAPLFKMKRQSYLSDLKKCGEIKCQVGTLIREQKYREALSLLEIEKLRDPENPELETIYWRTASRIRFCPLGRPLQQQDWEALHTGCSHPCVCVAPSNKKHPNY
jgi:hypothetical protein